MRNRLNNRGFTLIELLAVIIVLGVVMVISVPNIIGTMNTAKAKSFKIYSEIILTMAQEEYATDNINGETFQVGKIYSLDDLGLKTDGIYTGCVVMEGTPTAPRYTLYLSDDSYCYNGVGSDTLEGSAATEGNCIEEVKAACNLN